MAKPSESDERPSPPEYGLGETAWTAAKGGISMIPVAGPALVAVAETVMSPIMQRRLNEFLAYVDAELERHRDEISGVKIEQELFTSVVLDAANIAVRTRHEDKRIYLRNAVMNAYLGRYSGGHESMLLHYVDILSPDHIRVLVYLSNPRAAFDRAGIERPSRQTIAGIPQYLFQVLPEFKANDKALSTIVLELRNNGLISRDQLGGGMTSDGALQGIATSRGKELVDFIMEPSVGKKAE